MREMNYVLDRLDFKKEIVRTIPKAENTSKYKDNQQYGQSNQSDTINNTARTMQSKQYDQQYNQDKPGGGNSFIASSTYKNTKNLSDKPDV